MVVGAHKHPVATNIDDGLFANRRNINMRATLRNAPRIGAKDRPASV